MAVKKRIYQIDFLRFIAAIGVLLVHYLYRGYKSDNLTNLGFLELGGDWVKYCAVFIDLFFIISGFVITLAVKNKSVSHFFKSRVIRLFSVYWLCALITYLVTIFYGAPRFTATFGQFLFNLTMLQDFFDVPRLDGAYWTMSVELRFYALAIGYLILYKFKKISATQIAYIWLALTIVYPLVSGNLIARIANLFFMFEWSAAFIAGMLMAKIYKDQKIEFLPGIGVFICFCLSSYHRIIYAKIATEIYQETFSVINIILIMLSVYSFMLMVILGKINWLNKPYFLKLGIMTYPLYLLHQRIGYIIFNNLMGHVNKYVILIGTILLMIFSSFVIVKWVAGPVAAFLDKVIEKTVAIAIKLNPGSSRMQTIKASQANSNLPNKKS